MRFFVALFCVLLFASIYSSRRIYLKDFVQRKHGKINLAKRMMHKHYMQQKQPVIMGRQQRNAAGNVLVACTINIKDNNTISIVDPKTFEIVRKIDMDPNTAYGSSIIKANTPSNHSLYLFGDDATEAYADYFNVETLKYIDTVYFKPDVVPADTQYDSVSNKLFGLTASETAFEISELNLQDGSKTVLVTLPDNVEAVELFAETYDSANHRYYITAIDQDATKPYEVYQINTARKIVENVIPLVGTLEFIRNMQFDAQGNQLVGIINSTFVSLGVTTGKLQFYQKLDFNKYGFDETYAAAVDLQNRIYYILFETQRTAIPTFIAVDMSNMTFRAARFYNHIMQLQFVN